MKYRCLFEIRKWAKDISLGWVWSLNLFRSEKKRYLGAISACCTSFAPPNISRLYNHQNVFVRERFWSPTWHVFWKSNRGWHLILVVLTDSKRALFLPDLVDVGSNSFTSNILIELDTWSFLCSYLDQGVLREFFRRSCCSGVDRGPMKTWLVENMDDPRPRPTWRMNCSETRIYLDAIERNNNYTTWKV